MSAGEKTPPSTVHTSATTPSQHELIALRAQAAELRTTAAARGPRGGLHRGMTPGCGLDFAEVRPYSPGDDLRNMDWRRTARHGRPFTKLFHEEREQPVHVFVDLGPTMRFGSRRAFKSVVAARAAALIAWTAVDAGDRIGGVIHDGRSHHERPAHGRERAALGFIHRLIAATAEPTSTCDATCFTAALRAFARSLRPGACAIVLSDFHALDAAGEGALQALCGASRIVLVQVFDTIESAPPPPGVYRIAAPDGERMLDLRGEAARSAYGTPFRERSQRLAGLAQRLRATLLPLATHDDPRQRLASLFRPRSTA